MLFELKAIRKKSGLSQEAAAKQLGVPLNTYRNWEQLKTMPRDRGDIPRLARFFGVTVEDLFGEDFVVPGTLNDIYETPKAEKPQYRVIDKRLEGIVADVMAEQEAALEAEIADARAGMGALDADQVEFWVRRVMGRSDPLEAVRLFVRRVVVDRAAGTLTAEFTFDKKEPPPDGPGRGSRKYLGAGLWRLTANTSIYALPCGFAVVGESPRLAR